MATVQCARCRNTRDALGAPPFRAGTRLAELGREVQARVCAQCYRAWLEWSVKLVNETRLDAADPAGQKVWLAQMQSFLGLGAGAGDPWARFLNRRVRVEALAGAVAEATLVGLDPAHLVLADFAGGAVPDGFASGAVAGVGSATIARDAVVALEACEP